jgi:hypothetical protein
MIKVLTLMGREKRIAFPSLRRLLNVVGKTFILPGSGEDYHQLG